jgi:hypothetical protein
MTEKQKEIDRGYCTMFSEALLDAIKEHGLEKEEIVATLESWRDKPWPN